MRGVRRYGGASHGRQGVPGRRRRERQRGWGAGWQCVPASPGDGAAAGRRQGIVGEAGRCWVGAASGGGTGGGLGVRKWPRFPGHGAASWTRRRPRRSPEKSCVGYRGSAVVDFGVGIGVSCRTGVYCGKPSMYLRLLSAHLASLNRKFVGTSVYRRFSCLKRR